MGRIEEMKSKTIYEGENTCATTIKDHDDSWKPTLRIGKQKMEDNKGVYRHHSTKRRIKLKLWKLINKWNKRYIVFITIVILLWGIRIQKTNEEKYKVDMIH